MTWMRRCPSLTSRGWTLLGGGIALAAAGAGLGFVDLMRAGLFAVMLTALMWLLALAAAPSQIHVRRQVLPHPPSVGADTEVQVTSTTSRSTWLPVSLTDQNSLGDARWTAARLKSEETRRVYTRTPTHRGSLTAGPLQLKLHDPLGLTQRTSSSSSVDSWVIWPPVEPLDGRAPAVVGEGDDSLPRTTIMNTGVVGTGIREYAQGDDIRLVHWAATAHRGALMVRQLDPPAEERLTLLLAGAVNTPGAQESFEWLIRAFASTATFLAQDATPYTAHIGSAVSRTLTETMDELAQVTFSDPTFVLTSKQAQGLGLRSGVLLFAHDSILAEWDSARSPGISGSRPDKAEMGMAMPHLPRHTHGLAVVAGASRDALADQLRALGWSIATVPETAEQGAVAPIINPVLDALRGAR